MSTLKFTKRTVVPTTPATGKVTLYADNSSNFAWVRDDGSVGNVPIAYDMRAGLRLSWHDDDTIVVAPGVCHFTGGSVFSLAVATEYTFSSLDTGSRAAGKDYAVFATTGGIKFVLIPTANLGFPSGYSATTSRLLGYFHNGPDIVGGGADGAIFEYSVTSNDLLNYAYPYRAMPDLPAGIPLPGMVRVGNLAIGIYQASHDDATASAAGTSAYPCSRHGVVPWASITGWESSCALANAGCRMPTWSEWLMAAEFNPGSIVPALMNGNTNSGNSSDDGAQSATADPTQSGRTLVGTGPRTSNNGASASGRSWYAPCGVADMVGNVWEWVATFFGGLKTSSPGSGVAWGYEGDTAYNFQGQVYNPSTGGWTEGLPALLLVGGHWIDGAAAGVRAADAYHSPGYAGAHLGFRLAR